MRDLYVLCKQMHVFVDAALRRSKKRVRNVIQTELPYLLSKEMLSEQEQEGYFVHSSESGCSKKAILDMHMARWKSIFSQMDKALCEEGKHLVSFAFRFYCLSSKFILDMYFKLKSKWLKSN